MVGPASASIDGATGAVEAVAVCLLHADLDLSPQIRRRLAADLRTSEAAGVQIPSEVRDQLLT